MTAVVLFVIIFLLAGRPIVIGVSSAMCVF